MENMLFDNNIYEEIKTDPTKKIDKRSSFTIVEMEEKGNHWWKYLQEINEQRWYHPESLWTAKDP